MRASTSFFSFCLAVVLGLASMAHAATYNVTLMQAPDQPDSGDYTLAGAIEAANLDDEPAEVLIHLPYVWLDTSLVLENTMTIAPAEAGGRAEIYLGDGALTAFVIGPEASGSRLEGIWLFYEGTSTQSTAVELCETNLTIEDGLFQLFGKALDLQCGAVGLTVDSTWFSSNQVALSGLLAAGSVLSLTDIDGRGVFADLQAPACGGQLVVDDLLWGGSSTPTGSTINLAGCIDLTIRSSTARLGSVFLQASPLPSVDDSLRSVVLLDQVVVYDYASGAQPLLQFDGDLLTLRHTTVARNQSRTGNCATIAGGDIHLYHSVIAGNQCQTIALVDSADLQYSLVDAEWLGGSINGDTTSLALLGQAASFEGWIPSPTPDSPLRDAGDPALVPGVGGTPLTDVRGSARLTGAALDIGAAEFNRQPLLDQKAFLAHRRDQLRGRDADEIVVLNLRDYISDPDGHTFEITEIDACAYGNFSGVSSCFLLDDPSFYDAGSGSISATAEILRRRMQLIVAVEDELGLTGGVLIEAPPEGSRGGGGSVAGLLMLLVLLGCRRRAL